MRSALTVQVADVYAFMQSACTCLRGCATVEKADSKSAEGNLVGGSPPPPGTKQPTLESAVYKPHIRSCPQCAQIIEAVIRARLDIHGQSERSVGHMRNPGQEEI